MWVYCYTSVLHLYSPVSIGGLETVWLTHLLWGKILFFEALFIKFHMKYGWDSVVPKNAVVGTFGYQSINFVVCLNCLACVCACVFILCSSAVVLVFARQIIPKHHRSDRERERAH